MALDLWDTPYIIRNKYRCCMMVQQPAIGPLYRIEVELTCADFSNLNCFASRIKNDFVCLSVIPARFSLVRI
jgi:hypothetical protein